MSKLDKSLTWAENNDPVDNFEEIVQKIENDKN